MIKTYVTNSADALAAIAAPGDKNVIIDGSKTIIRDGEDYVPEQKVFPRLSRRQVRLALHNAGKLSAVETAINSAGPVAKITWEEAIEFERDNPLVNAISSAIGMSSSEVDALWFEASKL